MKKKSLQIIDSERLRGSSYKLNVFSRDIKYLKLRDVKRAYSKLIQDWCKGLVLNEDAKTLAYLLAGYIQTVKQYEIEQKLNKLEGMVKSYEFE